MNIAAALRKVAKGEAIDGDTLAALTAVNLVTVRIIDRAPNGRKLDRKAWRTVVTVLEHAVQS